MRAGLTLCARAEMAWGRRASERNIMVVCLGGCAAVRCSSRLLLALRRQLFRAWGSALALLARPRPPNHRPPSHMKHHPALLSSTRPLDACCCPYDWRGTAKPMRWRPFPMGACQPVGACERPISRTASRARWTASGRPAGGLREGHAEEPLPGQPRLGPLSS